VSDLLAELEGESKSLWDLRVPGSGDLGPGDSVEGVVDFSGPKMLGVI
jgi:hypothetical protein